MNNMNIYKRMKIASIYVVLLLFSPVVFVSCGDDEETIPVVTPTATGTMTDNDGNEYRWVRIGNLDWMAESSRAGEPWYDQSYLTENGIENYFYTRDDEEAEQRLQTLGNYYTYYQALENCPDGWRLPSDDDWKQLEMALGMSKEEADKTGWRTGAASLLTQGTEGTGLNFGFAGQLASYSTASIKEYHIGDYGYFWSSTIDPDAAYESAFIRKITPAQPNKVQRVSTMTSYRYISVRYCRDAR